jgi:23S rRNA pseudouridine1911/1915/1917 synthase
MIKTGGVRVDNNICKRPSRTVHMGEVVAYALPPAPSSHAEPEEIPLHILYEDDAVLVVNKPAGLVVHPAPGHAGGTLVNAVLFHCPDLTRTGADPARPGIVHRLDRDTSGVMVVAKTEQGFRGLAKQARDHAFDRRYLAIVRDEFTEDRGRIVASVGRSLAKPGSMSVTGIRGKDAVTHYEVRERLKIASLVALQLETGRTHQIRVHMRFAGHPVLGDPIYGVTDFGKWPEQLQDVLKALEGQALHAELLGFDHPETGEHMQFRAEPPDDFKQALAALRDFASAPTD